MVKLPSFLHVGQPITLTTITQTSEMLTTLELSSITKTVTINRCEIIDGTDMTLSMLR